jgi:hypothetical protein
MSDEEPQALLHTCKTAEAFSWEQEVEGTSELRTIHELDNKESLAIIERLYELGRKASWS